jgi:hypothetical protein
MYGFFIFHPKYFDGICTVFSNWEIWRKIVPVLNKINYICTLEKGI